MKEIIKSNIQDFETTNLTPIEIELGIDEKGRTTAKKLYTFLELDESHYSRWIKRNISENEFAEKNVDFIPFAIQGENQQGGRPTFDYKLSATFAKKLAMGTHSKQGERAREYFILVEKLLKERMLAERNVLPKFKNEIISIIDATVEEKINQIENKCSEYYKPSAATKYSISKYIKQRLGIDKANNEYELIKRRVLIILDAQKWEDIPIETLRHSMNIIDQSIDVIKKDRPYRQTSFI